MSQLALIRHGRTHWNALHRLQGRQDVPLSTEGRQLLFGLRTQQSWHAATWHSSPLKRARETALLLSGGAAVTVEPRLIEMNFGLYEGYTLQELRIRYGQAFTDNEYRGLDFMPPSGESPRQVQARLRPWLCRISTAGGQHLAVTHKGVIRALLSLAYDWPMLGRQPVRLDWQAMHIFQVRRNGRLRPLRLNVSLQRR